MRKTLDYKAAQMRWLLNKYAELLTKKIVSLSPRYRLVNILIDMESAGFIVDTNLLLITYYI